MGQIPALDNNQVLLMGKLSITNENQNIINIIWNAQGLRTGMFVGIGENLSRLDLYSG